MAWYVEREVKDMLPRHQALIWRSVQLMCDYLNQFNDPVRDHPVRDFTYDPAQFLDPSQHEYARSQVVFCRELPYKRGGMLYMELSVYDGDDGGSSMLYIHAERESHTEKTGRTLKGSYEEYPILKYGGPGEPNVVGHEPVKHEFTYEETKVVEDEEYKIRLLVHEFDTYMTPFYNGTDGSGLAKPT